MSWGRLAMGRETGSNTEKQILTFLLHMLLSVGHDHNLIIGETPSLIYSFWCPFLHLCAMIYHSTLWNMIVASVMIKQWRNASLGDKSLTTCNQYDLMSYVWHFPRNYGDLMRREYIICETGSSF